MRFLERDSIERTKKAFCIYDAPKLPTLRENLIILYYILIRLVSNITITLSLSLPLDSPSYYWAHHASENHLVKKNTSTT